METTTYPRLDQFLPKGCISSGKYEISFARDQEELEELLRLRYEVFNLELGEGLDESFESGMDKDEFDEQCHHLIIRSKADYKIVGTYRLQTQEMAKSGRGYYSSVEFDLSAFPEETLNESIEVGRACIHKNHRSGRALFLLWRGLSWYLKHNNCYSCFGCCSLNTQTPEDGITTYEELISRGHMHPDFEILAQPGFECVIPTNEIRIFPKVQIPQLMKIYLNYQAHIISKPAIDRLFKTIDFLTLLDARNMDQRTYKSLFDQVPE